MSLRARLEQVRAAIASACARAGRDPSEVTLIAVSKTHPAAAIREAYEAGQRDFGENYAQELRDKMRELAELADIRWHAIGHLQTNKARYVAGRALVHTLDREELGRELVRRAGGIVRCLVEVNIGEEPQKSGVAPADLLPFAPPPATRSGDRLTASVMYVDRFGSLVLGARREDLPAAEYGAPLEVAWAGPDGAPRSVRAPFAETFGAVPKGEPLLWVDSSGWLGFAVNQGSAAARYGLGAEAVLAIRPLPQE